MDTPALALRTVVVVGTGLIGGSLGLALRARVPGVRVVAVDVDGVAEAAVAAGAADEADTLARAMARADVVVIAAPPSVSRGLVAEIAPHLPAHALLTDVGSVKAPFLDAARRAGLDPARVVGGHPMAGREVAGLAGADARLFENAAWVLCPADPVASAAALTSLAALVQAVGARVVAMDADRHDRTAAAVSHVPQLAAVALVGAALGPDPDARRLAGGGFRDVTRIASSPWPMWQGILSANRGPALAALDAFAASLADVRAALDRGDWPALERAFDDAARLRSGIPVDARGFLRPLAELTVDAEDRPGFLARLTATLHGVGLNVSDLELLKVREGVDGVFRVAFATEAERATALAALAAAGFTARPR